MRRVRLLTRLAIGPSVTLTSPGRNPDQPEQVPAAVATLSAMLQRSLRKASIERSDAIQRHWTGRLTWNYLRHGWSQGQMERLALSDSH